MSNGLHPGGSGPYVGARAKVLSTGRTRAVILNEFGNLEIVSAAIGTALHLCAGLKSLDEHAAILASCLSQSAADMRSLLEGCLQNRWIQDFRPLMEAPPATEDAPPPIAVVAVVTADRPRLLQRCLRSVMPHLADYNGVDCLVVDGSRHEEHQRANREAVEALSRDYKRKARYVGAPEAAALRIALVRECDADLPAVGLAPGDVGSNRNLVALLTAGRSVLLIDDDVICDTWTPEPPHSRLAVRCGAAPTVTRYFDSRQEACLAAARSGVNIIEAHNEYLGHQLLSRVRRASHADLSSACSPVLRGLAAGKPQCIQVTLSGVAGDAGTYCQYLRLFETDSVAVLALIPHDRDYRMLRTREVHRCSSLTVLTDAPHCMATCMGLANTAVVPPFLPAVRNEDGAFGRLLRYMYPDGLSAHLMTGIVHDSPRAATYGPGIQSACQTRVSELVSALVDRCAESVVAVAGLERLAMWNHSLRDASRLPQAEFREHIETLIGRARSNQLERIDALLETVSYPEPWRKGLRAYRETLLKHLAQPNFCLPFEFQSHTPEDGSRHLRAYLGQFASLVEVWPSLWRAAQAVAE